jgi:N-dimethylarginine dimethylaminohydrolase
MTVSYGEGDKSWRMRSADHVVCMGDEIVIQNFGQKIRREETTWKT